jgi:hypothetical protein
MSLRLDTPPPDTISVDDSPFSSSHQLSINDLESPLAVQPLMSPQKRIRGHTLSSHAGRTAKRRLNSGLPVPEEHARGEPPIQQDTAHGECEYDSQLGLAGTFADDVPVTRMTAYPEYVDSVLGGAAGFFQLALTVFVVQGWDSRSKSATVGMSCFYQIHPLMIILVFIALLVSLTKSDLR